MKLKSKQKWALVGLVFILSWFGLYFAPDCGFGLGMTVMIVSMVVFLICAGYMIHAMVEAKVFERFAAWLKTDDV